MSFSASCQGSWDVYCNTTKVGTINTTNACQGDAVTNGCGIAFQPMSCTTVKLVAASEITGACCGSRAIDTMVAAVSAW